MGIPSCSAQQLLQWPVVTEPSMACMCSPLGTVSMQSELAQWASRCRLDAVVADTSTTKQFKLPVGLASY